MKSISTPTVSIVLPVFNGEDNHLSDTVKSILNQSHEDIEFIIVDDGSRDNTFAILSKLCKLDGRIRLLRNEKNEGLVKSLNRALKQATSDLIARIDCGEIAAPRRIELQYRFLQEHRDYVLVSSQAEWITMKGEQLFTTNFPITDVEIRRRLFIKDSILIHPAVMFRKINGLYYRDIAATAEDYDYWLRISLYGKMHILNEPLLKLRLDPDGTTYSKKIRQVKTVDLIHTSFMKTLRDPHAEHDWTPVKLNRLEKLQEGLFHLFTKYAVQYHQSSKLLYYVFKILSGISSPFYMFKLIQMMLKRKTISNDLLFQRYLSAVKVYND